MKNSVSIYFAFLFTLLVVLPLIQCNKLTRKLSESQVSLTCRKTSDFGFCAYTLGSDPRSGTADLNGLTHIALDKLKQQVKDTISYLNGLGGADPVVGTCLNVYGTADSKDVYSVYMALFVGDYGKAQQAVGAVMNDGQGCQTRIDQSPSPNWQMLSTMNKLVHDLSQLCNDLIGLLG